MKVQLLYFDGCPNVDAARSALGQALTSAGVEARVEELDVGAAATPPHLRSWGSPTILVDGEDVGGEPTPTGCSCRLYRDESGSPARSPATERISRALHRALDPTRASRDEE